MFKRILVFAYGVACYAIFFATFLYALGFVGNFVVPRTIDGAPEMPFMPALGVNLLLLGAFALQHSIMARPFFKSWLTQFIPESAERSTYVLLSSVALIALFYWWQPLGGVVWSVESPLGQAVLYGAFFTGWLLVLVSTFLINHFDLFGHRRDVPMLLPRPSRPVRHLTQLRPRGHAGAGLPRGLCSMSSGASGGLHFGTGAARFRAGWLG
jgi:protein-S-isoprenylcysteine O-methyltransferase Ste14